MISVVHKLQRVLRKPADLKSTYLSSVLIWNPLWVLTICFFLGGLEDFKRRLILSFLIANLVMHFCFAAVLLARWMVRRLTKLGQAHPLLKSRAWNLSVSFLTMPLGLYTAFAFIQWVAPYLGVAPFPTNADNYRAGMFIGTIIAGLYFAFDTRYEARESARIAQLKMKTLENESLEAQLAALTAQMNPHFLFNALNTVASLVATEPQLAEETILKLAELYRAVLDSSRNMTHSLQRELEICEAYLSIEKARFGDRLSTETQVAGDIDLSSIQIPALCLQPIVENAVKHGISPKSSGGKVKVSVTIENTTLQLRVQDDGIGFQLAQSMPSHSALKAESSATGADPSLPGAENGAGSAIQNCRDRLRLHYGQAGSLHLRARNAGGTTATITMPLDQHLFQQMRQELSPTPVQGSIQ